MILNNFKKISLLLIVLSMMFNTYSYTADDSLIGYWELDDLTDSSGNGNDLTVSGNPTVTSSNCKTADCYDFDNTGDYLSSGITGIQLWDELTYVGWFFIDSSIDTNGLFGYEDDPSGSFGSYCYVSVSNILTCGSHALGTLTTSVGDTTLTHVAYTLDKTGTHIQSLYVNGVPISSNTGTTTANSNEDFKIGYYTTAHLFDGKIDDVALFNKALTPSEINDIYLNGITVIPPVFINYLADDFDDNSLNTSHWTNIGSFCSETSQEFRCSGGASWGVHGLRGLGFTVADYHNITMEFTSRVDRDNQHQAMLGFGDDLGIANTDTEYVFYISGTSTVLTYVNKNTINLDTHSNLSSELLYDFKITVDTSGAYFSYKPQSSNTWILMSESSYVANEIYPIFAYKRGIVEWDNFVIYGEPKNLATGLISYITFDDDTANDISGSGINATPTGGTYETGLVGKSLSHTIGTDELNYASGILDYKDETINFWIKRDRTLTREFLLNENGGVSTDHKIELTTGNNIAVRWQQGLESEGSIPITNDGNFHMITITSNQNTWKSYVDGVYDTTGNIGTGGASYDFSFNEYAPLPVYGDFDELAVWTRELNQAEITELYSGGASASPIGIQAPTLDIVINTPLNNFNYTYDVSSFNFDVDTDYNSSCSYQDTYNNGSVTPFTSTGFLSHTSNFVMGIPVNQTLQYDFNVSCYSAEINDTAIQSVTVYRQPEPLEFNILVPQDQQTFDFATSEITFYMLTNYVANCEYLINNDSIYTSFDNTTSSVHTTNYVVPNETYVFNTNFSCYAPYVNETDVVSLTFFIEELAPEGMTADMYVELVGTVDGMFEVVGALTGNTAELVENDLSTLAIIGVLIAGMVGIVGGIATGVSLLMRRGMQGGGNFRK